jgi:hypothetical protein
MASPAGHTIVRGTVHSFGTRHVPAREAAPSYRDEEGKWHPEVLPREAYDVHEVLVLTQALEGGFLTVLIRADDMPEGVPVAGSEVEWVVRPYASRERSRSGSWYNVVSHYFVRQASGLSADSRALFSASA